MSKLIDLSGRRFTNLEVICYMTAESVALIKRYIKNKSILKSEIADLFCVSRSTISDLVAGRTWANIKAAEL